MTGPDSAPEEDKDELVHEVRLRKQRRETWLREGDMSIGRRLAQIGVLGWIIVTPMLGGMFAGRWLDQYFGSGLFWTAALLVVGLVLGGWFARKWIESA